MRILLIEDDRKIAGFVEQGLRQAAYQVTHAADGNAGLDCLLREPFDVAIVDIMLPGRDGLSLVAEARAAGIVTPIIYLSAKREVQDRVRGLQSGGDDYLTKPFAFSELLARIQALRRRTSRTSEPTRLHGGGLEMDLSKHRVTRQGREIVLQPREYAVLECLLRHKGTVVSKTMLMEQVWEYSFDPETSVVETTVSRLRARLNEYSPGTPDVIRTLRGIGYVVDAKE
jgi:two-component system OmpR family response regulator